MRLILPVLNKCFSNEEAGKGNDEHSLSFRLSRHPESALYGGKRRDAVFGIADENWNTFFQPCLLTKKIFPCNTGLQKVPKWIQFQASLASQKRLSTFQK